MSVYNLPAVNATLNATSAVLLLAAFIAIKRRHIKAHAYLIIACVITSMTFLTCYLIYHAHVPTKSVKSLYPAVPGWLYHFYLWIVLLPHTLLAVGMLPMIGISLYMAYKRRWATHRRVAPWTFGIWLYVSITGVIIYWMLYHLFPGMQPSTVAGVVP
jgi:putative membrane protein